MKRGVGRRVKLGLALFGSAGLLFQVGNLGCFSFGANSAIGTIDFCFLLNCNDGALGGLFDFCAPINFTSFTGGPAAGDGAVGGMLLADCPEQ